MLELVHEKCLMIIKRDQKFDAKKKEIKRKNSASYYFSKARKRKKQEKVNVK